MSEQGSWPPVLTAERAEQIKNVVMAEVRSAPVKRPRRRRRLVTVVLAILAVLVAGVGTAVAFLRFAEPTDQGMVRCFALATTDFEGKGVSLDAGFAGLPGQDPSSAAQAALDICSLFWLNGELLPEPPYMPAVPPDPNPTTPTGLEVPPLAACVLPEGFVGVFPGPEGTCAELGLPESTATA